jgi:ankyrin repeat protein
LPLCRFDLNAPSAVASSQLHWAQRIYLPDLPARVDFPSWAVGGKTPAINELLFEHGMHPSQPNWLLITPLHEFARKGDVAQAKQFIAHGADLNARDEDLCSTPLGWAAKFGQRAMVRLLLKHGAQTNLRDDPAWATPLAWATRRGQTAIARLLKKHGAI